METIAVNGIVADPQDREDLIVTGAQDLVYPDGRVDVAGERALIEQITYLVEAPNPLLGTFDESYLALPDAVLTTVMRKHQRYLPVRDADGALLPMFVAVANGVVDVEQVRTGNEAVLRARYEDAAFFYRADRQTPLPAMRDRLTRLTFTDKLGSMADRAARIATLAVDPGPGPPRPPWNGPPQLVKFDLGSQLVTEMTSLAGVMARDYALNAGESRPVAQAIYEAELPRSAGDDLPASLPGALLSLADRLDLVAGLAATVGLPTGSSDPFAVRRAVLGLLAVHRAHPELASLSLTTALARAARVAAGAGLRRGSQPTPGVPGQAARAGADRGGPAGGPGPRGPAARGPAVVGRRVPRPARHPGTDPAFLAVAEALARTRRIVPADTPAGYDAALLKEPAEVALHEAVDRFPAGARPGRLHHGRGPLVARGEHVLRGCVRDGRRPGAAGGPAGPARHRPRPRRRPAGLGAAPAVGQPFGSSGSGGVRVIRCRFSPSRAYWACRVQVDSVQRSPGP